MKKIFGSVMCLILLSAMIIPVSAQRSRSRYYGNYGNNGRYENRNNGYYGNSRNRRYRDNRSWWDQHRDKATVGIGAGAGAAIGGLTGGKKGAIIGALLGAGGAALYTYKLRDRNNNRRYYRNRR